jgi:predicted Na+-dependent transporter
MPLISPFGIALGFLFSDVFIHFRHLIPWIFALMTLPGAMKLEARELGKSLCKPVPVLAYFVSAHAIMPLLAFFLAGIVFRNDSDTVAGYVLLYASPSGITAFIWVGIFKGNLGLALALILLDTIAAPLVMPGTVFLLLRTRVSLDIMGMALSLLLMIVLPTIVGVASNEATKGKAPAILCPYLDPLAKLLIILVMAANVSAVAPQIDLKSSKVWIIAIACAGFSVLGFVLAKITGIFTRLDFQRKTSLFFTTGLRNSVAASTIAIAYFPEAAAQPALMMIMFQQVMASLMGKLMLGKKTEI